MRQIVISRPIEIVAGSGLTLKATVVTFGNPVIQSKIETNTDSEDLDAAIATVIDLAVA